MDWKNDLFWDIIKFSLITSGKAVQSVGNGSLLLMIHLETYKRTNPGFWHSKVRGQKLKRALVLRTGKGWCYKVTKARSYARTAMNHILYVDKILWIWWNCLSCSLSQPNNLISLDTKKQPNHSARGITTTALTILN